ncbi:MAG TPA: DUF4252 domain-containing protein [Acidobacteriaceae bacterium]|nr:DUF4252 domain-containing protein [Acidobacteriaceae bacterium]
MKKTMGMAATLVAITLGSGALLAQDSSAGAMVSVSGISGLNLQVSIGAKVKDDLLAGTEKFAQGASKVTEINLDPTTMAMVGPQYGKDAGLTGKMKLMVVRSYSYDKPGMYRMEDVEAYVKKLEDGSWSCPVVSREKENNFEKLSYICAKTDSDQTNEMVIFSAEPQKIAFIHMAGTMSLNDLSRMQDSTRGLNIRGGGPWPNPRMYKDKEPTPRVPPVPPVPPVPAQH